MRQDRTSGQDRELEARVLRELERLGSCALDTFVRVFPEYTWRQVLAAVDRLNRGGSLTLRKSTPFEYVVEAGMRRAS